MRKQYLSLLGIPVWERQQSPFEKAYVETVEHEALLSSMDQIHSAEAPTLQTIRAELGSSRMLEATPEYLGESGGVVGRIRKTKAEMVTNDDHQVLMDITQPQEGEVCLSSDSMVKEEGVDELTPQPLYDHLQLTTQIENCERCQFSTMRLQPVIGWGAEESADILFITDTPLKQEMMKKKAIVAEALILFKNILKAIKVSEEKIYVTPFIKCRPDELIEPTRKEKDRCFHFLAQEIGARNPKVIVLLGRTVAQLVLEKNQPYQALSETMHTLRVNEQDYPVVVAHSPSILLKNPRLKAKVWHSFKGIARLLAS